MKIGEFISHLRALKIDVKVENGHLLCTAAKGVITDEIRNKIKERRDEIIRFLQGEDTFGGSHTPISRRASIDQDAPLSYAQQSLWIVDKIEPNSSSYNLPVAQRIRGELEFTCLKGCIEKIVRRHEVLRTVFVASGGEPVQKIQAFEGVELPIVDFGGVPEKEREKEVALFLENQVKTPFDLAKGPLFRACLLRLRNEEHILFLNFHHCVFDGQSISIFMRELTGLYEAYRGGARSRLPDLPARTSSGAGEASVALAGARIPLGHLSVARHGRGDGNLP